MTKPKTLLASAAIAVFAAFGAAADLVPTTELVLPLPVTNLVATAPNSLTISWADYSNIVGWQLYTTDDLTAGTWTALDNAKLKTIGGATPLARLESSGDDTVFPLSVTATTFTMTDTNGFYRLQAVNGIRPSSNPAVVTGTDDLKYILIDTDTGAEDLGDIYIKTDENGVPAAPPSYWIEIDGDNGGPTQVWPDGNGGWTTIDPTGKCNCDPCECNPLPGGIFVFDNGTIVIVDEKNRPKFLNPDGTLDVDDGDIVLVPPYLPPYVVDGPGTYDPDGDPEGPKVTYEYPDERVVYLPIPGSEWNPGTTTFGPYTEGEEIPTISFP
ncbi:MAG: hypothetical protein FWG05_03520, partial [Kiritimatiellaeota bacterium]|nr:hypothetical protein [Kiritimatiellota bacterium]